MLREIGATRGQIRKTVVSEALLLAALGTAFGILAGLYLSYVFVAGLNAAGYMKMAYSFPLAGFLAAMAVGLLFGVLAALMLRARRRGWRLSRRCGTSDHVRRAGRQRKKDLTPGRSGVSSPPPIAREPQGLFSVPRRTGQARHLPVQSACTIRVLMGSSCQIGRGASPRLRSGTSASFR